MLQDQLDAHRVASAARTPPEATALMQRVVDDLARSGAADRARKAGDVAPSFALKDSEGREIRSADLLAKGPLVVTFYRGTWCPYCNLDLQALHDALPEIQKRGANLVSISPQNAVNSRKVVRTHALTYPILSDPGGRVAEAYGVRWQLPDEMIDLYRNHFRLDLTLFNDDDSWTLPMPGRFVIGMDGIVAYAEVNPDYKLRPDPSELLPILDRLARAAA